jgi:uncharacterized protein YggE
MLELLLSVMLAATTTASTDAKTEEKVIPTRLPGVIMTSGTGEISVLPDRVVMSVSLYNVDKDLATAFTDNDKVAKNAGELLTKLGVPKTNIMVTNVTVQPEYENKEQTKIKRYRIWRSLSVIIDDLQLAGKCLDALLNAGAVDVSLDRIIVRDQEKKQFEAWKAALSESSRHVNEYSDELNAPLARLEWASDSPQAYSIYRTRRSVILGKLREEAGAARDLSQLMQAEQQGYYPAAPAPPPVSTPMGWTGEASGYGAGYGGGGTYGGLGAYDKRTMYRNGELSGAESLASLSVSEQKYYGQFYVNMITSPALRPGLGEEGMIFIEGKGVARMRLDRANLTCRVYSTEKELATAYTANDSVVSKAQKELDLIGIKTADVSTTNLSVYPEYQNEATGKIRRYRVVRDLKIKLDPLTVGEACAALVRSGVNDIDGLSYELADRKALEDKARAAALEDARKRAELVANSFGQRLGSLEWSSENPGNYPTYLFGKTNPEILTPTVQIEQNEMVAYVNVLAHYFAYPQQ